MPLTYWRQSPRADFHLASLGHDLYPEAITVASQWSALIGQIQLTCPILEVGVVWVSYSRVRRPERGRQDALHPLYIEPPLSGKGRLDGGQAQITTPLGDIPSPCGLGPEGSGGARREKKLSSVGL